MVVILPDCPLFVASIFAAMRIGVVPGYFFHHLQPPVHAAVMSALETMKGLGARIVDVARHDHAPARTIVRDRGRVVITQE